MSIEYLEPKEPILQRLRPETVVKLKFFHETDYTQTEICKQLTRNRVPTKSSLSIGITTRG